MKEPKARLKKLLSLGSPILAFLFLWEVLSRSGVYNINLFPPPTLVAKALYEMILSGELLRDAFVSLSRVIIGYCGGAFLGISVGVLTGRTKFFQTALVPLIQLFRPIPPISYVPLAILWFGLGEVSKYFLVFIGVFFPIWINTHLGVAQVSIDYIWAARSLGANDRKLLFEVILPASLPFLIAGMRTSIAIAFYCLVAAEIAGAFSGLAFRVSVSHLIFRVDKMMGGLVVLGILSAIADKSFTMLINKLFPWYEKTIKAK